MATPLTDQAPLDELIQRLDDALERNEANPENVEARFQLVLPLERAAARLPDCPASFRTPAERIAQLLWFKTHAGQTEPDLLLPLLRDAYPLVRIVAADALATALERIPEKWSEPSLLHRVRTTLQEQRTYEPSLVISYQIDRILQQASKLSRGLRPASGSASTSAQRPLNPYVAGPVIDRKSRFFGREETLREIRDALGEGSGITSIVISGARRTGKTSLLYRLRDGELGDGYVVAYVDLQGMAGRTLPDFLRALLETIVGTVRSRGVAVPTDLPGGDADLALLQRHAGVVLESIAPACLVILFDEYEVLADFIRNDDVARQLQSLIEQHRKLFFVFAGAQKVEALKEKNFMLLLDNCKYMKISYLKPEEVRRLITEPSEGLLQFPDDVIGEIQELCAGHPFYTQLLCHSLFDLAQGQRTVTRKHVEGAVQHFLENPAPHLILGWNGLALEQKVVASAMAELQERTHIWVAPADLVAHLRKMNYPIRVSLGEVQQTLGGLRELDWFEKKGGERFFRFALGVVRRWVVEHRSVWEVLEEYNRKVVERTARLGRRLAAAAIDAAILLAGLVGAGFFDLIVPWRIPFIVLAYYLVLVPAFGNTPGMVVARIRLLSETGVRLQTRWALQFAALMSVPFVLLTAAIPAFERGSDVLGTTLGVSGVVAAVLQAARIHFSKSGRGLFDSLAHAVVVRQ